MKSLLMASAISAAIYGSFFAAATSANATNLDAMKAEIAKHQRVPEFVAAGEPFDATNCMKGKKILSVPFSNSIAFVNTVMEAMTTAAKKVGFQFDQYKNSGQHSQWIQGIQHGVNQKYDLIDLFAPDLLSLVPQAQEAKKAGIPVVASHDGGFDQKRPDAFLSVPIDYQKAGELEAMWAITKTEGKANVLVITALDSFSSEAIVKGVKTTLEKCGDCKVEYVNVAVGDWSSRIQPLVQAALLRNPKMNFIIPTYDDMARYVVPAVELTQSSDRVKIATFNGTPAILDLVRQGKIDMDIGENLDWIGHGVIDAEMRIVCGLPHIKDPKIPLYIFDKSNVEAAGVPAKASAGMGDAYVEGYKKLWMLK
ncbi:sugar ABC transporter substrate-binding protein [Mesorhizobium sp. Root695]|uniref:sugar ABC transporter substrate-binding protein n=1 Tax=Mesorhizobium sp. Root695 TaxID=1736589 RepID=UPI0009EB5679|nr:sugar ABC transporter substrate-binding protein [Mesorhizobium sp. Root695]